MKFCLARKEGKGRGGEGREGKGKDHQWLLLELRRKSKVPSMAWRVLGDLTFACLSSPIFYCSTLTLDHSLLCLNFFFNPYPLLPNSYLFGKFQLRFFPLESLF